MASDRPSQDIVNRLYEVKQELAMKAASDSAFRKNLLSDPLATIEKEYSLPTGALAQSGLNIEIVEEKPNTIMVPILPSMDDMELSDDQLEAVAGGLIFELIVAPIGNILGNLATRTAEKAIATGEELGKEAVGAVATSTGW